MLKLIIEDDEGHTTVVPLVRDEVFIGRKEGNTIRLTERNVSRRHARLLRQDAAFAIEDLGSYTGVKVNGQRISLATPLKDGDRIQIGDYRLDLRSDEARPTKELPILGSPAGAAGAGGQAPGTAQGSPPSAVAAAGSPVGQTARAPLPPTAGPGFAQPAPSFAQPSEERTPPPLPVNVPGAAPAQGPVASAGAAAGQNPASASAAPTVVQPPSQARSPVPRPTGASTSGANPATALSLQTGAPSYLEGTPTIPLRTLESPPEPATIPEQTSRLVVLNTDLAGHEYSLGRASQVIGRTDENDIVLNHRSISRHHAKILREGARTTIVDLQSANGVRVNGQDYERVELHPGDIIELGHVKLRHVGPGEEFLFTPSKLGGRIKPVWLAGGAGGAAVLAAVLFFAFHSKSPPAHEANAVTASVEAKAADEERPALAAAPSSVPPSEPSPTAIAAAPVAAAGPMLPTGATAPAAALAVDEGAAPHPPAPASAEASSPKVTLAAVNQAIAGERWEDASATLSELLKRKKDEPGAAWIPEAEALKGRIAEEKKNAAILGEIDQALAEHDGDRALKRMQAIPSTSAFKVKALGRQTEAVRLAVKQRLARADADLEKGACDELRAEERAIHKLDPENQEATAMVRSCRPPHGAAVVTHPLVAARTTGRAAPAPAAAPGSKPRAAEAAQVKDSEDPKQDPSDLIRQAREAWLRQQCDKAIDLSKKALKLRAGSPDAYQIIAVCACSQRDAESAQKAYSKLDERNRSMVRSTCVRNGVHLPE